MPNKAAYYESRTSIASVLERSLPEQAFFFSQNDLKKLKTFSSLALAAIGVAGAITLAAVAPNIFQAAKAIPKLRKSLRTANSPKANIAKTFYYLKRHGYVKLTKNGKDFLVEITEAGKNKLRRMSFDKLRISKQIKWDGNWWVMLADIPTKEYKRQADLLRQKVKDLGFYLLQRTVWVYPFDPRTETAFVAAYYGVEKFVTIIKTSWIDPQDEAVLKNHFHLK